MDVEKNKVTQMSYENFADYSGIKNASMTEWINGEGMDVSISRKHMNDINISLTIDDITFLRRMFSDFDTRSV